MSDIEQVTHIIFTNFDIAFIVSINVLTYSIIKIVDYFNGTKKVSCGLKRLILLICTIVLAIIYKLLTDIDNYILLNSSICAPVIYSWIIKPIITKIGVGYKTDNKK